MDKHSVIAFDIGGTIIRPVSGDWYLTLPLQEKLAGCGVSPDTMRTAMNRAKKQSPVPVRIASEREEAAANLAVYRTFFSLLPEHVQASEKELLFFSSYRTCSERLYEYDPAVIPVLAVVGRKKDLALFSNTVPSVIHYLRDAGILQLFRYQVFSCDRGMKKPDPAFFELFLSVVDRSPPEVALYDDSARVVQLADRMGIAGRLVQFDTLRSVLQKDFS